MIFNSYHQDQDQDEIQDENQDENQDIQQGMIFNSYRHTI